MFIQDPGGNFFKKDFKFSLSQNLRICNLQADSPKKSADLQIKQKKFMDLKLRNRIPQKFSDLRWRIEPKNLRICDLQT
jgi:hypothetical protein